MYRKLLIIVVSAATLTACVSDDPRTGGFFGGLRGINSGEYDSRIQRRTEELSRQENINQDLKNESKTLKKEAKAWEAELASEQQRIDDLDDDLATLESDVNELKAKSASQKTEIAALIRRIGDQKRRMKSQQAELKALELSGGRSADPDRYRVLQQERHRLADEYKKLLKYSQALSNATK